MITVHMKKWFSCVLAALILAAVFASCGEKQDAGNPANHQADPSESVPDAEETEAETEDPLFGSLTSVDLGGETVRASVSCGHADGIAVSSYEYIAGPEELTGESCQDYAYERNSFVENMLNCSLEISTTTGLISIPTHTIRISCSPCASARNASLSRGTISSTRSGRPM